MTKTTPALHLPYPEGTDRVMDGDNAIQALAERIELAYPRGPLGMVARTTPLPLSTSQTLFTLPPITIPAGRMIRLFSRLSGYTGAAAAQVELTIAEGVGVVSREYFNMPAASAFGLSVTCILTPAAGSHTYYAQVGVTGGNAWTVNPEPGNPAFLMIEDLGPAVASTRPGPDTDTDAPEPEQQPS